MDKRVETADGRTIFIHVDDHVVDAGDAPPIESDIDDPEEGATEAMILVDPAPNTMTVEGAIASIGKVMRHRFGPAQSPQPGHWWHDWGKYLVVGVIIVGFFAAKTAGLF
jgi:hypothetical protein